MRIVQTIILVPLCVLGILWLYAETVRLHKVLFKSDNHDRIESKQRTV